jgi:hypothetical protein
MTLKLVNIEHPGDLDNERVVLQATADTNIGIYILMRARATPDNKVYSGPISSAYWFDTITVKASGFVVLYSKLGLRSQKTGYNGVESHFFYWGFTSPVWTPEFKAVRLPCSSNSILERFHC